MSDEMRRVLDYLLDETTWTCPACGYSNIYRNQDGSLRLECKYCNDGTHPLAAEIALTDGADDER